MPLENIAAAILEIVGKDNIIHAYNCMTRLRLQVNNITDDQLDKLKNIEGVMSINNTPSELQIILGPGKAAKIGKIFNGLLANASSTENISNITSTQREEATPAEAKSENSQHQQETAAPVSSSFGHADELRADIKARNATPYKLLLKKIASIFLPLIPGFIACGLISGILGVLLKLDGSLTHVPYVQMLAVMGNAIFFGMNLFVGINAAKEFGGSTILGGILAAILTHPLLSYITLYDQALVPGRGGIIAVLLVAILGAKLETWLRDRVPEMLDLLVTPLLVILIAGFAALLILQPVGGMLAAALGNTVTWAIESGGALAGFILGGLWLPIVMLGLHQIMTPIHVQLLQDYGMTILLPILAMAGGGQVGASLAVYFKTKNQRLKRTIATAFPVGIMGIGEPLIYGVTLPLGRPFICACLGGAFGGAAEAIFMVGANGIGISGLPLAALTTNIPMYLTGLFISYIAGFVITWLAGFDDPMDDVNSASSAKEQ